MDVFVIQPTNSPVNDNLMELLIMIDAFKRASAGRITAVLTRQEFISKSKMELSGIFRKWVIIMDTELLKGANPNGGTSSQIYYYDVTGRLTDKDKAVRGTILEFDKNNKLLHTTYFIIT